MGLLGAIGLAATGIGAAKSLFGGKKKSPNDKLFDEAITAERSRAKGLETTANRRDNELEGSIGAFEGQNFGGNLDEFGGQQRGFDAQGAVDRFAQGAFSDFNQNLKTRLGGLRDASVGAGRLDTGFFDQDQGDVITEVGRGFTSDLARTSLDAAGIEANSEADAQRRRLQALEASAGLRFNQGATGLQSRDRLAGRGQSLADNSNNRFLDLVVGGANRDQQRANASAQNNSNLISGGLDLLGKSKLVKKLF